MELHEVQLSLADEKWCRKWLRRYTFILACLTNDRDFTELAIAKLIVYESQHDQRLDLLNRLMARFSKLRRKREWDELIEGIRLMKIRRNRNEEEGK